MISESDKNKICDDFINALKTRTLDVNVEKVNSVDTSNSLYWASWKENIWSLNIWITSTVGRIVTKISGKMPQRFTYLIIGRRR